MFGIKWCFFRNCNIHMKRVYFDVVHSVRWNILHAKIYYLASVEFWRSTARPLFLGVHKSFTVLLYETSDLLNAFLRFNISINAKSQGLNLRVSRFEKRSSRVMEVNYKWKLDPIQVNCSISTCWTWSSQISCGIAIHAGVNTAIAYSTYR